MGGELGVHHLLLSPTITLPLIARQWDPVKSANNCNKISATAVPVLQKKENIYILVTGST